MCGVGSRPVRADGSGAGIGGGDRATSPPRRMCGAGPDRGPGLRGSPLPVGTVGFEQVLACRVENGAAQGRSRQDPIGAGGSVCKAVRSRAYGRWPPFIVASSSSCAEVSSVVVLYPNALTVLVPWNCCLTGPNSASFQMWPLSRVRVLTPATLLL